MRVLKRNPWLTGLGTVLSLLGLWLGTARAAATTDEPASVLFFPKVIADGTRDTLIQITNVTNQPVEAHCEYVNASGQCSGSGAVCSLNSDCAIGESCVDINWQDQDFFIALTKQQPTIWRVSTGRNPNLILSTQPVGMCDASSKNCPGISFTQILPPPLGGFGFRGQLICYEVDDSDAPIGNNAIKGEATIQTLGTVQISEYNAIGFRFLNQVANGATIALDGDEYEACPAAQLVDHYAEGADDIVATGTASCPSGGDCPVANQLTMVPCSADFENVVAGRAVAQLVVTNEFETNFSASTTVTCWWNGYLDQLNPVQFNFSTLGSTFARTQIRPATGFVCTGGDPTDPNNNAGTLCTSDADCTANSTCEAQPGLLSVVEDFHSSFITPTLGTAAGNGHFVGSRGFCQAANTGLTTTPCTTNADCTAPGQLCATDSIVTRTFSHMTP